MGVCRRREVKKAVEVTGVDVMSIAEIPKSN